MDFLIDTNTYSDYMRQKNWVIDSFRLATKICIPVIVIGELKKGFHGGNKVKLNYSLLENFIAKPSVQVIGIDINTAEQFGQLSAYLKKRGTPIPINDIWIAALCVQYNLSLLTRDSDFKYLPQVELV